MFNYCNCRDRCVRRLHVKDWWPCIDRCQNPTRWMRFRDFFGL